MKYLLIKGNPVDGFQFVGPFNYHGDAIDYADAHQLELEKDWWIAELQTP